PNDVPKELVKLQGVWRLTSAEAGQLSLPAKDLDSANDYTLVIAGNEYAWRAPTSMGRPASAAKQLVVGRAVAHAGTPKADSEKKALDLAIPEGRYQGNTLLGLFELKGDTLKIATTNPGGRSARPEDLKSEGHFLYTFERDPKVTKEQAASKWKELKEAAAKM